MIHTDKNLTLLNLSEHFKISNLYITRPYSNPGKKNYLQGDILTSNDHYFKQKERPY